MNKEDFFNELAECLQGEVSENEYRDAVSYYKDYFREQEQLGRSDDEVLSELGSARYIAHSIIDAHGIEDHSSNSEIDYDADTQSGSHVLSQLGRTIAIIAALLVVGAVLRFLLPVILIVIVMIMIMNMFRRL